METREQLQPLLIDLLFRQSYAVLFANFAIPLPVAYVLRDLLSEELLLSWVAALYLLTTARILLDWRYRRQKPEARSGDWRRWAWRFTLLSWISSGLWGALGWFAFHPNEPQTLAFICIVITGIASGAVPSLSAFPLAYAGSLVAILLPFAIRCFLGEGPLYDTYLIFTTCLFGVDLYYSRVTHRTLAETARLRFENLSLIGSLQEQRDRAQSADRAKSRFLAAASHDLRQPIHALGLFISTLGALGRNGDVPARSACELAERARSVIGNLSGLLDALLDISKLDAGVLTVAREPVALRRLFSDLKAEYAGIAGGQGLDWRVMTTDIWVDTDPMMLKRILDNLISNAFRYTQTGTVLLGCRRRGAEVEIQVWDTGVGIPKAEQEAVFEEFVQLANPARDRTQGLGLGLAIVERTAALLGHRVKVVSKEGRGSTFSIIVPVTAPLPVSPSSRAGPAAATQNGGIIVVDDERDALDATALLLTTLGYRVYAGRSAAAACREHAKAASQNEAPVDLVLTDYRLEDGQTGIGAIRDVSRYFGRDVPALILSGDTSPARLKEVTESGYRLLHKPLDAARLEEEIEAMVAGDAVRECSTATG
ncbi:response regulator [Ensifer adhaerens]|uniref:hybrid sensor histidine kinase/response regulator n=1 Tax=Ensifer adhaerens TaxID=106592 RepID=UPI001CC06B92|nr:hybrid sensor histidine kinase/response regulator [Ensifer adhaerens]MBZ7925370.1 response regulator [Ensifer adhaerens]UAX95464.1 response regulator [Ensifer adhaerens]UAY02645.1 response regulator [Ensifer adhaerens]UAY10629.1 response regulator [Ensifer adhaerens]